MYRICVGCKEEKTLGEFTRGASRCKVCRAKKAREEYVVCKDFIALRRKRKVYAKKWGHETPQEQPQEGPVDLSFPGFLRNMEVAVAKMAAELELIRGRLEQLAGAVEGAEAGATNQSQ